MKTVWVLDLIIKPLYCLVIPGSCFARRVGHVTKSSRSLSSWLCLWRAGRGLWVAGPAARWGPSTSRLDGSASAVHSAPGPSLRGTCLWEGLPFCLHWGLSGLFDEGTACSQQGSEIFIDGVFYPWMRPGVRHVHPQKHLCSPPLRGPPRGSSPGEAVPEPCPQQHFISESFHSASQGLWTWFRSSGIRRR